MQIHPSFDLSLVYSSVLLTVSTELLGTPIKPTLCNRGIVEYNVARKLIHFRLNKQDKTYFKVQNLFSKMLSTGGIKMVPLMELDGVIETSHGTDFDILEVNFEFNELTFLPGSIFSGSIKIFISGPRNINSKLT